MAAPLHIGHIHSSPRASGENTAPLFEAILSSKWLFVVTEAFLYEEVFAQRVWLLPPATALAAEAHWPRLPFCFLVSTEVASFSSKLLSEEKLVNLMRCAAARPLERRTSWVSFTTTVAHQYVCYDSTSGSLYENPRVRRKESPLAARARDR